MGCVGSRALAMTEPKDVPVMSDMRHEVAQCGWMNRNHDFWVMCTCGFYAVGELWDRRYEGPKYIMLKAMEQFREHLAEKGLDQHR
jgi:hypothetical protein